MMRFDLDQITSVVAKKEGKNCQRNYIFISLSNIYLKFFSRVYIARVLWTCTHIIHTNNHLCWCNFCMHSNANELMCGHVVTVGSSFLLIFYFTDFECTEFQCVFNRFHAMPAQVLLQVYKVFLVHVYLTSASLHSLHSLIRSLIKMLIISKSLTQVIFEKLFPDQRYHFSMQSCIL